MQDKELERKNQLYCMNVTFGALKNYDGFKNEIENIVDNPKESAPRPLRLMRAITKLAEANPDHVEFVCRASSTGSFSRFGKYLEKLDGPKDYGPENRTEFPPRETDWETMSSDEKLQANLIYGMQVSFGHLPNPEPFVKDIEKIFDNNKGDRALRLLKSVEKYAEANPHFSGPILRAQQINSYKILSKTFARMDIKDAEKAEIARLANRKKQKSR